MTCAYHIFLLALLLLSSQVRAESTRILLIGNSYSFYNELPSILQQLARKAGHNCQVDIIAEPGIHLSSLYHMEEFAETRNKIQQGKYHWVILQEQSQLPSYSPEESLNYISKWCQLIMRGKAQPLLYATWAHLDEKGKLDLAMHRDTCNTYYKATLSNNAKLAPVGEAWKLLNDRYKARAPYTLHLNDGSHPSPLGSYIAACCLYAQIYQKSPVGLSNKWKNKNGATVGLTAAQARNAQQAALSACKKSAARLKAMRQRASQDQL